MRLVRSTPPATLWYEGRPLARPDEELVDQGLAFDLGTLFSRRQALRTFGLGAVAAGVAACGGDATTTATSATAPTAATATTPGSAAAVTSASLAEIPDETAGPYPGDGSNGPDILSESGVVRSDIRTSIGGASGTAEGVPLTLEFVVRDLAGGGVPYEGVAVYAWHCDREGRYSMYSQGVTAENYLRGVQVVGADGKVRFTTVFPGCYDGRWPHVHFEVYPDVASITDQTTLLATSQLAFPKDACDTVYAEPGYESSVGNLSRLSLASDGIFADDTAGAQLATMTGDVTAGYAAVLPVGIDTTTAPAAGGTGGPPR